MIGKSVVRALNQRQDAAKRCATLLKRASSTAAPQISVPAAEDKSKPLPYFRTRLGNPTDHSSKNAGQFYTIDPNVKKQLFLYGGLTKEYAAMCKTFRETCLMIREPALEIMDYLKTANYNNPIIRYCLYGPYGTGKTMTLAHLLHYGFENNFVIIHAPFPTNWYKYPKEFTDCTTKPGFVDLPLDAAGWLIHFKNQNAKILADPELTVLQDWEWSKREITKKGSPLSEIIEMGINRVKYSTICIEALFQELKQLSDLKKCKTMVVIDGFNAFFTSRTKIKTADFEKVSPQRVTITSPFVNLAKLDWSNGAVIISADDRAIFKEDQKNTDLPYGLLGKEGFELLDPFIPVELKKYSEKELDVCLDYYLERKWIINPHAATEKGRKELAFLSNNNPNELMKITGPL